MKEFTTTSLDSDKSLKLLPAPDAEERTIERLAAEHDVSKLLSSLKPEQREVLTRHFGLNDSGGSRSIEQVAQEMGLTPDQVRRTEKKAIEQGRYIINAA